MQCRHCGRQISDGSTFCPLCGRTIIENPNNQESHWVSLKDTRLFIKKIDDFKYHITDRIDVGSPHIIGEVRSDDMGRSWKYRAFVDSGYIMEGICDDLEDGTRSIIRDLWGR